MKTFQRIGRRLALWAATACLAAAGLAGQAEEIPLRLIAINDLHGALLPRPFSPGTPGVEAGGAAHLAGWIRALKGGRANALVLGTGDLIGGSPLESSLFWDEPTIELLNLIGLDAAVVGNHEFDKGWVEFMRMVRGGCAPASPTRRSCPDPARPFAGSRFPWLGANVIEASGSSALPPSVVFQVGSTRVGVVGVVTRDTPQLVMPSGIAGLRFEDEVQVLREQARRLRASGVQTVIALAHEGGSIEGDWNDLRCPGAAGRIFEIARALAGEIDVLFSGHSHRGYNCRIGDMPVMQAQPNGRGASVVDLRIDAASGKVIGSSVQTVNVHMTGTPLANQKESAQVVDAATRMVSDTQAGALAARYALLAREQSARVVARLGRPLPHLPAVAGAGDTAAGRLIADAQWHATRGEGQGRAQFALMNPGGVRSSLACAPAPCDVTFGELFQMQPFGNQVVTMTLSGEQVRQLLEQQAPVGARTAPRFLQPSASLRYEWVIDAPAGQRAQSIEVAGQPLDPGRDYRVTVNSFLADGGDGFSLLRLGRERLVGPEDVGVLSDYLSMFGPGPVDVPEVPRIRIRTVN